MTEEGSAQEDRGRDEKKAALVIKGRSLIYGNGNVNYILEELLDRYHLYIHLFHHSKRKYRNLTS